MATYIHSTCGQTMVFPVYRVEKENSTATTSVQLKGTDGKPMQIKIEGGAYVLLPNAGKARKGAVTKVTDEELELLHANEGYMRMKARGFFTEHSVDHLELDASGNPMDMEKRDNTAQISDKDHANGTDDRISHAGTRAFTGENNQIAGQQPLAAQDGNYGLINM